MRLTRRRSWLLAEEGAGLIRHMALNLLIAGEIAAAAGKDQYDSAITPANHAFDLVGEQQFGPYRSFVAQAIPKWRDKHLFEGKVWIDHPGLCRCPRRRPSREEAFFLAHDCVRLFSIRKEPLVDQLLELTLNRIGSTIETLALAKNHGCEISAKSNATKEGGPPNERIYSIRQ